MGSSNSSTSCICCSKPASVTPRNANESPDVVIDERIEDVNAPSPEELDLSKLGHKEAEPTTNQQTSVLSDGDLPSEAIPQSNTQFEAIPQSNTQTTPSEEKKETKELDSMQKLWNGYLSGDLTNEEKKFFSDVDSGVARRKSTLSTDFTSYAKKHVAFFDQLRGLEAQEGWILKKTQDTVDIYSKTIPGEAMIYIKGITTMKCHGKGMRHLVSCCVDPANRPKFDEMCAHGETIESYLPYYRVVYLQMKSPVAVISARDLLCLSRVCIEDDGALLLSTESFEHPKVPESPQHVRAHVFGGYTFRPTDDPDVVKASFMICADPRGWLPAWAKALVAPKQALVLAKFKTWYDNEYGKGK